MVHLLRKITYFSGITGFTCGQFIGFKIGYEESKHYTILENSFTTITYGFFTGIYGGIVGMCWYITLPVAICRIYSHYSDTNIHRK